MGQGWVPSRMMVGKNTLPKVGVGRGIENWSHTQLVAIITFLALDLHLMASEFNKV